MINISKIYKYKGFLKGRSFSHKRYKRLVSAARALVVVCLVLACVYELDLLIGSYRDFRGQYQEYKQKRSVVIDKYKGLAVLALEKNLPKELPYFNALASAAYDGLPKIERIVFSEKNALSSKEKSFDADFTGCYQDRCLSGIVKDPEGSKWARSSILNVTIRDYWKKNGCFIFLAIVSGALFLGIEYILMFSRYCRVRKRGQRWVKAVRLDKNKIREKNVEIEALQKQIVLHEELADSYFPAYLHDLIEREVCLEELSLYELLEQAIKSLYSKRSIANLKVSFAALKRMPFITSDREIVSLLLLNFVYKIISKAKLATTIIFDTLLLPSGDVEIYAIIEGYDYSWPIKGIEAHRLSSPILEKLCNKIEAKIVENRVGDKLDIRIRFYDYMWKENITDNFEEKKEKIKIVIYEK